MLGMLLVVASLSEQLDIRILVLATHGYRHNVVKVAVFAKRLPAAGTLPLLELEKTFVDVFRQSAADAFYPSPSIMGLYSAFLWIRFPPSCGTLIQERLVCNVVFRGLLSYVLLILGSILGHLGVVVLLVVSLPDVVLCADLFLVPSNVRPGAGSLAG
jgi:hypothetical protein